MQNACRVYVCVCVMYVHIPAGIHIMLSHASQVGSQEKPPYSRSANLKNEAYLRKFNQPANNMDFLCIIPSHRS